MALKGIQRLNILLKKVCGNQSLGEQFTLKALDLIGLDLDGLAVFFFLLSHILIGNFPPSLVAVIADRIHIILHGLRPVFHQHFIDIVFVEKSHLGKIIKELLGNFGNQLFGVNVPAEFHQIVGNGLLPSGIGIVHLVGMADKLRVGGNRGNHFILAHRRTQIPWTQGLKQDFLQRWVYRPIFRHAVHIGFRNTAVQVSIDVL